MTHPLVIKDAADVPDWRLVLRWLLMTRNCKSCAAASSSYYTNIDKLLSQPIKSDINKSVGRVELDLFSVC